MLSVDRTRVLRVSESAAIGELATVIYAVIDKAPNPFTSKNYIDLRNEKITQEKLKEIFDEIDGRYIIDRKKGDMKIGTIRCLCFNAAKTLDVLNDIENPALEKWRGICSLLYMQCLHLQNITGLRKNDNVFFENKDYALKCPVNFNSEADDVMLKRYQSEIDKAIKAAGDESRDYTDFYTEPSSEPGISAFNANLLKYVEDPKIILFDLKSRTKHLDNNVQVGLKKKIISAIYTATTGGPAVDENLTSLYDRTNVEKALVISTALSYIIENPGTVENVTKRASGLASVIIQRGFYNIPQLFSNSLSAGTVSLKFSGYLFSYLSQFFSKIPWTTVISYKTTGPLLGILITINTLYKYHNEINEPTNQLSDKQMSDLSDALKFSEGIDDENIIVKLKKVTEDTIESIINSKLKKEERVIKQEHVYQMIHKSVALRETDVDAAVRTSCFIMTYPEVVITICSGNERYAEEMIANPQLIDRDDALKMDSTKLSMMLGVPNLTRRRKITFFDRTCTTILHAASSFINDYSTGTDFGSLQKLIKPYKRYLVPKYTNKPELWLKTNFGTKRLKDNSVGLYLKANKRKYYIYRWSS